MSDADRLVDKNGRRPGESGYIPVIREAPSDFAAYQAQQKAKKEAAAAATATATASSDRQEKLRDKNGRMPGESGYIPVVREAPTDFAAYQSAQKAKKAAEGK
jgi:hypothetical protein